MKKIVKLINNERIGTILSKKAIDRCGSDAYDYCRSTDSAVCTLYAS